MWQYNVPGATFDDGGAGACFFVLLYIVVVCGFWWVGYKALGRRIVEAELRGVRL